MTRQKTGAALRAAREATGRTRQDIAYNMGIAENTLARWETGVTEPSITQLCRLADLYGQRPVDLLPSLGAAG
jgi:transcriptional regulator with XRE-family HTH domain